MSNETISISIDFGPQKPKPATLPNTIISVEESHPDSWWLPLYNTWREDAVVYDSEKVFPPETPQESSVWVLIDDELYAWYREGDEEWHEDEGYYSFSNCQLHATHYPKPPNWKPTA